MAKTKSDMRKLAEKFSDYFDYRDFRNEFLRENPPEIGHIIYCKEKEPARVYVKYDKEQNRWIMYVNAIVDYECTGWYLTSEDKGLKCLINPSTQEYLKDEYNGEEERFRLFKVRVVNVTSEGRALVVESLWQKN